MKIELECLSCIFRQVLEAGRMVTDDEEIVREIINEYAKMIPEIEEGDLAPEIVTTVQTILKDKSGQKDPYQKFKQENIELALSHYPETEDIIEESDEPLSGALIMSAMGNSIDAGVSLEVDLKNSIKQAVKNGFNKSDYGLFKEKLLNSKDILIIADNAGEAVFDRLLIKELNNYDVNITYAVREEPILNDVTLQEARSIGIGKNCNLISSGCKTPGLILENTSKEFKKIYHEADLRISKGQGNLEGLSTAKETIFFLLKAKCELVANLLNVNVGDFVFIMKE